MDEAHASLFIFFESSIILWWLLGLFSQILIYTMASFGSALRSPSPSPGATPPVTIVVASYGIEPELDRNVASVLGQNYRDFQVIFSIASWADESRPVIEAAMRRFPSVTARIDIGEVPDAPDPQIGNLMTALATVNDDLVLAVDSNAFLQRDSLRRLVAYLEPDVGVVAALPVAVRPLSIGGLLECAILNGIVLPYMLIWSAQPPQRDTLRSRIFIQVTRLIGLCDTGFPQGKCMLYRFREFVAAEGMERFRHGIFSDLTVAEVLRSRGWRSVNANFLTEHPVGSRSISLTFQRYRRWTIAQQKFLHPLIYADLLGNLCTLCIVGAVAAILVGLPFWSAVIITVAVFVGLAGMQHRACGIAMRRTFPVEAIAGQLLRTGAILVSLVRGANRHRDKVIRQNRTTSRKIN